MDIPKIISVDFRGKRKVNLPQSSLNGPGIKKIRERFLHSSGFDFLFKNESLKGIIQILKRAGLDFSEPNQRYSYHSGLSKNQWYEVLERKIQKAKPFSDN